MNRRSLQSAQPYPHRAQLTKEIFRSLACIHLHELQHALHLRGWYTQYEPGGAGAPRLNAWHPVFGELDVAICAVYRHLGYAKPGWWFEWASGGLICRAKNMHGVVGFIEAYVRKES